MDKVTLTIDGVEVVTDKGTTILQAALQNDIYIPHLCDYEGLTPFSGCRVCLVEIEGRRMPVRGPAGPNGASLGNRRFSRSCGAGDGFAAAVEEKCQNLKLRMPI